MSNELKDVARRAGNYREVWDQVEGILRKDAKEQLEGSKGPDGRSYPDLKASTLKQPRRSKKPYDTQTRKTWGEYVNEGGGRVTKGKDKMQIRITAEGAGYAAVMRPVGVSDKAAEEIAEALADHIVGD